MEFIEHNSPHIRRSRTTRRCMQHVMIALLPATLCAFYYFGLPAVLLTLTCIASCCLAEWGIAVWLFGDVRRFSPWAAALTGWLLALNLPSSLPLWIAVIGSIFAIGIGKMAFGGLGCNIFNPALVGRVFLLISFPVAMTTWPLAGNGFHADGATGATILSILKQGALADGSYSYTDMIAGNMGGSMGEVASVAIIIGLVYLLALRVISWHIPVSIIATVALFDLCIGTAPLVDILSGGLLFGSIFMATDYVTSPMTHKGMLVYGVAIALITVIIRRWGAYPEGMSFAILIMNGFTPLINRYTRPARFGASKERRAAA